MEIIERLPGEMRTELKLEVFKKQFGDLNELFKGFMKRKDVESLAEIM
jgi:hypothetical protein